MSVNKDLSISQLNRDCLYAIFNYLNIRDQYNFAKTCTIIQIEFYSYLYWKQSLNFNNIKEKEFFKIMEFLINNNIQGNSIRIHGNNLCNVRNEILHKLMKYFTNIIKLELFNFQIFSDLTTKKLFHNLKNLKELTIIRCELNDLHCLHLSSELKCLEKLDISENYVITGQFLHKLEKLNELNLNYCKNIKPFYFIQICKVIGMKLRCLHIGFCDRLNEVTFRGMIKYLIELNTLTISGTYRTKKLKLLLRLPKLKNLKIHGIQNIKLMFFQRLWEFKSASLERLTIIGSKRDKGTFDIEPIFNLMNLKCLSLKYLDTVTDEYLEKVGKMDSLIYFNCAGCKNITANGLKSMIVDLDSLREIDISLCTQIDANLYIQLCDLLKGKRKLIMRIGKTPLMEYFHQQHQATKILKSEVHEVEGLPENESVRLFPTVSVPKEWGQHKHFRKPVHM